MKHNNECIGQISVIKGKTDNLANKGIGWFINPKHQGRGYATETAKLVLDYMFNSVNIDSISTRAAIENEASWKLMEKLGFKRIEGNNSFVKYTFLDTPVEAYSYRIDNSLYNKKIN